MAIAAYILAFHGVKFLDSRPTLCPRELRNAVLTWEYLQHGGPVLEYECESHSGGDINLHGNDRHAPTFLNLDG